MEGNDDVGEESTFSHCGEPAGSPVAACGPADGAERVGGAFELVVCGGRFCHVPGHHQHGTGKKEKKIRTWVRDSCEWDGPPRGTGAVLLLLVGGSGALALCGAEAETASHSLVLALALTLVSGTPFPCPCLCRAAAAAFSSRSRARRSSHRARSASARARTSALCRRHSTTCASYSAFHASCSAAETETEEEDNEDDGSGVVRALVPAPASAPAVRVGAEAAGSDVAVGWEGETRGISGGTEKGSERAAFGGKVVGREGEDFWVGDGYCGLTLRRSSP
jgi:hypothetical protein